MTQAKTTKQPINLMLIEDNMGDIILAKRAFEASGIASDMQIANSAEKALEMLECRDGKATGILPDLILLDLNMPKMSGQQFLKIVKSDDMLKHIPVIILSSSLAEKDIVSSYEMGANSYLAKPRSMQQYKEIAQSLAHFWFTLTVLPSDRRNSSVPLAAFTSQSPRTSN